MNSLGCFAHEAKSLVMTLIGNRESDRIRRYSARTYQSSNLRADMEPRDAHSFWGIYSLGDLSSILAFLITILNAYLITSIKRRIMINVTIVPLRDRLRSDSLELNNSLAYFETSFDEFNQALGISWRT